MHDNQLEQYKNELEQIEVPEELKEKTIARMKEQALKNGKDSMPRISPDAEEKGDGKAGSSRRWLQTPYAAAVAAFLLIGVGAYSRLDDGENSEPVVIVQEWEDGSVLEEVALSEGNLIFSQIPTELQSFGMQMGVIGEEESAESGMHYEYEEDEEYEGVGYEIVSVEGEIPHEEESLNLSESRIGDVTVRTGYYKEKDKTIFIAYFQAGETGYKVKGIGVTQQEFVQKVLSIMQEK